MKLRTFLYVLGAMGAAYAMITLFVANRAVLMEHTFHFWGGIDLPVGLTLILFAWRVTRGRITPRRRR